MERVREPRRRRQRQREGKSGEGEWRHTSAWLIPSSTDGHARTASSGQCHGSIRSIIRASGEEGVDGAEEASEVGAEDAALAGADATPTFRIIPSVSPPRVVNVPRLLRSKNQSTASKS